jgi:hypothetical protein
MRDEKQFWNMSWNQPYTSWTKPVPQEPVEEDLDLTQAREVLARIMSK